MATPGQSRPFDGEGGRWSDHELGDAPDMVAARTRSCPSALFHAAKLELTSPPELGSPGPESLQDFMTLSELAHGVSSADLLPARSSINFKDLVEPDDSDQSNWPHRLASPAKAPSLPSTAPSSHNPHVEQACRGGPSQQHPEKLQERLVAFEFRTWDPFEDEDQTLATERLPAFEFRTWDSYDDEPLTTVSADTMRASLQAVVGCRRRPSQHPKKPQERLKNARAVRASQQEQNRGGHEASLAVTAQPEQPQQQQQQQQQKHHDHPTTSSPTLPASGDVRRPRHVERAAGNVECVAPPPEVLNPGSAGHPEMCAKICFYFLRGNCENGSRCGYCHCPHTSSRKSNLDRMSRDFIRDVHHSEAYRLMLPEVLKKLQRQGFDLRGLPILDMPNLRQDARNRVRRRRLAASLAKVSLRDLLTHMARRMPTETPESDSCNAMLDQVNNCCTSLIPGWETGALWEHRDICGGGAPHSRTIA